MAKRECTFTYSRKQTIARSATADGHTHDANKPCDIEGRRHALEQQGQKQLWKPTVRKPLKRSYTQLHLDAGQVDFACTACKVCGFIYAKGKEEDEKLHTAFHDTTVNGFTFQGWQNERVIKVNKHKSRIVLVLPGDSEKHLTKVKDICSMLEDQLGLCKGWLLSGAWQVYLYVLSSKRLVGCVVVEKINSASPVATSSKTLLSGFDSPVASAQPSTYIQPLTPLSAPPLGQHSQSDHGDRRTAAIAATGVSCPMSARQRLDSNELPVPHLSLPLQDLNHGHAVYQPRPALHTALHRGTLQHASRKDTLLTRWLAASKCKATFGNCAARLQAEQPSSASSAVGCKVGSQEASRVDLGCTSPQCSNVACPDHLNHHAHTMHCGASEHTAVLTDGKVDQGMQPPDTPSVAAQTEEVVGSFNTSAQASSMTGPTSDDCGTSSFDCAAARSPAQPVGILAAKQSRPQHIVLMDTTKSVKADCGIKVMWVSNEHQRRGIATQLLDAVRCNAAAGFIVPRHRLAFSQPTMAGHIFAQQYTGTCHFLVYQ